MKILYTAVDTPLPGTDGGSVHVQELCRALARRQHDVHVAAPAGEAGGDPVDGFTWHDLHRRPRFLEWSAVGEIRAMVESLAPDVVVERFYTFGGAGIWAAHQLGVPAVLEVNSPARPYPGSWRDRLDRLSLVRPVARWRRRILGWSDGLYTTSDRLLPPEYRATAVVVTNGVDTTRFRPAVARSTDGPLRAVYASSFRGWHGAEDLVEAVRRCAALGVDVHVTCLGDGPRLRLARTAAGRAGLGHLIDFVGRVPFARVPAYLAAAHIGLAPFDPGAFSALQLGWFWSPIKIFEYLAAGLGVVTIDIAEMRELLPASVAWFYRPGDAGELAETLRDLADNRDAVRRAGHAARQLAETRFGWDRQAMAVEALLHRTVEAATSGRR